MGILRTSFRFAASLALAAAALFPGGAAGNHYILDCTPPCSPPGPYLYVGNLTSHHVAVVDTRTDTLVAAVGVGQPTYYLAAHPASTRVYASDGNQVIAIDAVENRAIGAISPIMGDSRLADVKFDRSGSRVFVFDGTYGAVRILDVATNRIVDAIWPGENNLADLAEGPGGHRFFLTHSYSDTISVIDAATRRPLAVLAVDNPFTVPPTPAGDFSSLPLGIVLDPSGKRAYVATGSLVAPGTGTRHMLVMDTDPLSIRAYVPIGNTRATRVAMNPSGTRVYLSNGAVVDTGSLAVIGKIPPSEEGLAFSPDGSRIYIPRMDPPELLVLDAESNEVTGTIPLFGKPYGIAGPGGPGSP